MRFREKNSQKHSLVGATLTEALIAIAIFGVAAVSLFGGVSFGFTSIGSTREELRANQILIEKMETIRLYSWDQINTPGFIPTTFSESYYPQNLGSTNGVGSGVSYSGTVSISAGPSGHSYSAELRRVDVGVSWTSGSRTISRSISTLVSRGGLQRYIY